MLKDIILVKILVIPAILIAFTVKGWIQAKMAIRLGDNTPKEYGRDTFNPLHHIDIVGFIFMLIIGFGWTKPMQINRNNFKNYYKDDLKVRAAGLAANLAVGFIASIAWVAFGSYAKGSDLNIIIYSILYNIAVLNCTWFVLNLLPIPGFEGFYIILDVLKSKAAKFAELMYRYNMIIFLFLVMPLIGNNSVLGILVGVPGRMIFALFCNLGFMVF